jgi:hypothetical protein
VSTPPPPPCDICVIMLRRPYEYGTIDIELTRSQFLV